MKAKTKISMDNKEEEEQGTFNKETRRVLSYLFYRYSAFSSHWSAQWESPR